MISTTKTHVLLDRESYAELRTRANRGERVAGELRAQLAGEHRLLLAALHELAGAAGAKDRANYARLWLRKHRRIAIED